MQTKVRVAIVDPYAVVRNALKVLLDDCPDLRFVGETQCPQDMVSLCEAVNPDVVLFDFGAKDADIAVIEQLRHRYPQVKVLVLTASMEIENAKKALAAGANGYICKTGTLAEIQGSILSVYNAQLVIDKSFKGLMALSV